MITVQKKNNKFATNLKEFLADYESDVLDLPTECEKPGSCCLVVETGNLYILNNNQEWKIMGNSSNSGSSGGDNTTLLAEIQNLKAEVQRFQNAIAIESISVENQELIITTTDGNEVRVELPEPGEEVEDW